MERSREFVEFLKITFQIFKTIDKNTNLPNNNLNVATGDKQLRIVTVHQLIQLYDLCR